MMIAEKNYSDAMNKKQIFEFIQHYEKITKWMMQVLPYKANITISVDKKQKIKEISLKTSQSVPKNTWWEILHS